MKYKIAETLPYKHIYQPLSAFGVVPINFYFTVFVGPYTPADAPE